MEGTNKDMNGAKLAQEVARLQRTVHDALGTLTRLAGQGKVNIPDGQAAREWATMVAALEQELYCE